MTIELNYGQIIPELAKKYQVIAVELQGHGRTADIERPISFASLASDISGLLDHLKLPSANVLGYSFGATVALKFAIDYPQKIKKLIFVSSAYKSEGWSEQTRAMISKMKPEFLTPTPLKTAYDKVAPDTSHWISFLTKMIAFDNQPFDLGIENIKKAKIPALIINGDYDGVEPQHSVELFKAFGGGGTGVMAPTSKSRYAIVPGTTHVTLMMQTKALADYILAFLAG